MQQIRRDTIKTISHRKVNIDTMSWNVDTSFTQDNKESFEAVINGEYKHPVNKIELTAFDTIVPCDVSLYPAPTYYTAKTHNVRNAADIEMPMNYDILFNGVVFGFTLFISAKYVLNSVPHWINLITDLKQEFSKA
jgi:hypothetical protein